MIRDNVYLHVHELTKVFQARKRFGRVLEEEFRAVNALSFQIKEGEVVGLLGPNGAGKTTTIQMLLDLMSPTSGHIEYFGKQLTRYRSAILQQVGFASTYVRLPGRLTIYENLDFYGRLYGINANDRKIRIQELLTYFDIWHFKDREVGALSAGQLTKIMIIKAFFARPRIVLLDEPTASLDPDVAQQVRNFLLAQQKEHNVAMLITSHNMDEVTTVCDRVLVLRNGTIIADNTPEELATSVSTARVHLVLSGHLEQALLVLHELGLVYEVTPHELIIHIDEEQIARLLIALATAHVYYETISIDKPTLEDYFLELAKR